MTRDELRPSPDALLAETRAVGHGLLKIFLGAAPGVGKTYEMLSQGLTQQQEGIDVVVGIVETHGRSDTRNLADRLPALPRQNLDYHGRSLQEFDLDTLLQRRPQLALIDELAHSNVPGSRHAKRWQDIEEILEAGIDVYTTLNIQHLTSLNDVVARISHITVRETVPDHVLERADQIELVDLPPDDLIRRLNDGKVYVPEAAQNALQHFFSRGNLTALREMAMRTAAEHVDADVLNWRRARAVGEPWPTRERIMVLVGDSPEGMRLVRLGKRLAERRHAAWIVAHVNRPTATTDREVDTVRALELAEELGADTFVLAGQDLVEVIIGCATEYNVTQIVVGRSMRRWRFFVRRSLASALLRRASAIDITVAAAVEPRADRKPAGPYRNMSLRGRLGYAEAILATACATALCWFVYPLLASANLGIVFLCGILFTAIRSGIGPALLAGVLSFLSFTYFFTEPRFSLSISSAQDLMSLLLFLLIATVTGQLAVTIRRQMAAIAANNRRLTLIEDFSRRLAGALSREDLASVLAKHSASTLGAQTAVMMLNHESKLAVIAGQTGLDGLTDTEEIAAQWAHEHREPAGSGTGTLPGSHWLFVPLLGKKDSHGVLGVRPPGASRTLDPEQKRLLFAMRDQAGIVLEKLLLSTDMERTRLAAETDKLRAALLSSVSHDLRTPLVSIKGAASALLELDEALGPKDKAELLDNLLAETERLNRYIQNLIDMTRLGYGVVAPRRDWRDVRDIIGTVVRSLEHVLGERRVDVAVAEGDEFIHTDNQLLETVLVNLLENAAKYSPEGSLVRVAAARDDNEYTLSVCDQGSGIPPADRDKVFDMFHRAQTTDQRALGTGMGLAICKGLVESLGGSIAVLDAETTTGFRPPPSKTTNAAAIEHTDARTGTCIAVRLPQPQELPPLRSIED